MVYLVSAPSGRSFAVKVIHETQTYEPIDYIDPPDEKQNDTRQGTEFRAYCICKTAEI